MTIQEFIKADTDKVEKLIEEYPSRIPVTSVAEFLGMDGDSIRSAIECGSFGIAWRKAGKLNKAYCIPTATFVRWYMHVYAFEKVNA